MIGRGTRLLEPTKIKPWCKEKDKFLIMDCWNNFEYFQMNPQGKIDKPSKPITVRLFETKLEKLELAEAQGENEIRKATIKKYKKTLKNCLKITWIVLDAKKVSSINLTILSGKS